MLQFDEFFQNRIPPAKQCIFFNFDKLYLKYKNFFSIDPTCVAIVTCWGAWGQVTQYLLWYVFVVFIVHRTAFNKNTGFLLGQSFRLAVEKSCQIVVVIQLVITRWRFGSRIVMMWRNVAQNWGISGCRGSPITSSSHVFTNPESTKPKFFVVCFDLF